jgi:S1-C subfamily serine protease
MNLLDLVIVGLLISAAVGGYRLGFFARAVSWVGMGIGLLLAARTLPWILERMTGPNGTGQFLLATGILLGGAFVGQAIGLLIGSQIHLAIPPGPARLADRAMGMVAGTLGILLALWLLLPAMADVPGTASRLARNSSIAQQFDRLAPDPPDTLQALRRLVGEGQFPRVFANLRPTPDVGPPPAESGLGPDVIARATAATVKVEGVACRRIQEGSGFVVAPGIIITNAHVVAGQSRTEVIDAGGRRLEAAVVVFDPDRDLAVLRSAALEAPPLPVGDTAVGGSGAVFGHPGGGPLRVAPFEIREQVEAVGRDLYDRRDTRREVFVVASELRPGDSGAALVDPAGDVVGVAFAIAPDRPGTAYALSTDELRAALGGELATAADTGPCLV